MFRLGLLFCVWAVFPAQRCSGTLSGLYADNGLGQTVVQELLTVEEKLEVEEELLGLLGVEERPRPGLRAAASLLATSAAPNFLLDVYSSLSRQEDEENTLEASPTKAPLLSSEFNLSGPDLQAIRDSDVIMTLTSKNRHVPNVRHERGKRLWFDVSEIPVGRDLVGAELRLYQMTNYTLFAKELYTLTIYSVLNNEREKELEYVDSVNTTGEHHGWLIFNMTRAVTQWMAHPENNRGLYLSLHLTHNSMKELLPEDIGITTMESGGKEPFVVVFLSNGPGGPPPTTRVRVRRGGDEERRKRWKRQTTRRRNKHSSDSSTAQNPLLSDRSSPSSSSSSTWSRPHKTCQIQTLYVSFKDLKWEDWIIAPVGYEAFYCSGECNFPLNAVMNATNHAVVQTLVHLMNPVLAPKPCCAPTKLSTISVLFLIDTNNVVLKKYKNMVVKSCGCH